MVLISQSVPPVPIGGPAVGNVAPNSAPSARCSSTGNLYLRVSVVSPPLCAVPPSYARCQSYASVPIRMAQFSFHASLNVTGDEKLRALSPPLAQAPPASSSGQPGAGSWAGVATDGRYGTTAGPSSCARATAAPPTRMTAATTADPRLTKCGVMQ